jgi:hypothetical protein
MITKRLFIDYLILVGIPLAIIVVLLQFGEYIQAPPTIDGAWVMQAESPESANPCWEVLSSFGGRSLVISQSGRYISAIWDHRPRTRLYGLLENREFTLSSLRSSETGCDEAAARLNGRIVDGNGGRSLEARLQLPGCGDCAELEIYSNPRAIGRSAVPARGYH